MLLPSLKRLILIVLSFGLVVLTSAQDNNAQVPRTIIWSADFAPSRVEQQQAIINRYLEQNPQAQIEFVVLDEVMMTQMMQLATAQGQPPDILFYPTELTPIIGQNLLLSYTTSFITEFGVDSFSAGALAQVRDADGRYYAIPLYGMPFLLIYRNDWFESVGLAPPFTFEAMRIAATTLHNPDDGRFGFCGPTNPDEVMINQIIETLALANGVSFIDRDGALLIDTPAYREAIQVYADLMRHTGEKEDGWTAADVRDGYMDGSCAMIFWPLTILDELAGLQGRLMPTCPECQGNPQYLAANTRFVARITNAENDASLARFENVSMALSYQADAVAQSFTRYFIEFLYLDWLAMQPEARIPLYSGGGVFAIIAQDQAAIENPEGSATDAVATTPDEASAESTESPAPDEASAESTESPAPDAEEAEQAVESQKFSRRWTTFQIGIDTQLPINELYDIDTIEQVAISANYAGRLHGNGVYPELTSLLDASYIREAVLLFVNAQITIDETMTIIKTNLRADLGVEDELEPEPEVESTEE